MKKYIKHLCAILILLCTSASAWGATSYTATYTIASKTSVTSTGTNPSGSSASYTQDYTTAGQMTAGSPNSTLTLSGYDGKKITGVKLNMKNSNSRTATVLIKVASTTIGSVSGLSLNGSLTDKTISITSTVVDENEQITIKITASGSSVYIDHYTITWEDATPHDVSFVTGDGNPSIATRRGVSITLPDEEDLVPACSDDGWELYGWTTSAYGSSSTTTAPTATLVGYGGDTYWPDDDVTLYAVYTKVATNEAATAQTLSFAYSSIWTKYHYTDKSSYWLIHGNDGYIESPKLNDLSTITSIVVQAGYFGGSAYGHFQLSGNGTNYGSEQVCSNNSESTSITINPDTNPLSGSGKIKLLCTGTASNDNGVRVKTITINYTAPPSYYWSAPTCAACTTLDAPVNLEESSVTPTSVQLSWDAVSNASSYKVTIEGSVYEKVVNNITTTSVTVNDLSEGCGAEYLWTVKAIGDGEDYCDSEESATADFTTPTLSSIALSGTYPTDFAVGDAFSHDGQVVTATYSNGATKVVTGSCSWTGYNMSSGGDQTVTVHYTECTTPVTTTYGIHIASYGDYVFSCAELTLTAYPETADAPIFITSVAGKKVRSQGYIQITGSGLTPSTTLTFPDLPAKFEIKTATYGALATDVSGAIDEAAYIFYTPDAGSTTDGLDEISGITVTVGGAKMKTVNLTQDIIGRHLPADFVIAGKKDGKWYALPDTMTSTTHPAPIEIAVDNAENPSVAYTAATNIYNLYGQNSGAGYLEEAGQYVKLGMKNNPTYANYPLLGTASTAIGKSTGTDPTHNLDQQYWWLFTQTNTSITNPQDAKYIIHCANNTSTLSIKNDPFQWGLYASGVEELRLIPASSIVFAEAEIVEWGQHGAIVEVDKANAGGTGVAAAQVKAKLNGEESSLIALVETGTSKGSSTKYDYTVAFGDGIDFAANAGQMLTLEWYNSSDVKIAVSNITVPKIITANATMSSIAPGDAAWSSAEVHVLPGVTLTANAGDFESNDVMIKHLEIYPGATVEITKGNAASGTLKVKTLVLRNGWTRVGSKKYDVARLYITPSTASLAKNAAADVWYSDWYIDYDQYYPVAVPWNVTVENMSYKNTSSAASAGVKLLYYDGASRANNAQAGVGDGANWKEYSPLPVTLTPGLGYAMTAKRPSGKAFSIVRMPLTIPSADWTEGGEKGNVIDTHKDQVTVTAYGASAEPAKPTYLVGWNFIGNPYMSIYQGELTHSVDGEEIAYVNIPDESFRDYGQYPAETKKLLPASGFFIQTGKTGTLTFGTGNRQASAPSYRNAVSAESIPVQKAYVDLTSETEEDMMGIWVADKYTEAYEMNADLEKLLGDGTSLRTYMRYGDMNMAYVAINETLAKEWIPVLVRIPEAGEYTFSLNSASKVSELEGVYLIDYENGDQVTNLLEENYSFTTDAGTISNRFAINAIVGERPTPTDIDAINGGTDASRPIKFIYRENVYIMHNGAIYDATGKKVREINK